MIPKVGRIRIVGLFMAAKLQPISF